MFFSIQDSNNQCIFQAELVLMLHATSASEVAKEPIMHIYLNPQTIDIKNKESFDICGNTFFTYTKNSNKYPDKLSEIEFKLFTLRGEYHWIITETGY